MVTHGVATETPFVFSADDQVLIAEKIAEACHNYHFAVVACNVLPDHVHMVLTAETERELNERLRKIKGYSSFAFQRVHQCDTGQQAWAQKFNRRMITGEEMLQRTVEYVMHNHLKHAERWGERLLLTWQKGNPEKDLKPLAQVIQSMCMSVDDALR
jgi:REP element-mobilizing transposase RayT